jgi:hypothetical protein
VLRLKLLQPISLLRTTQLRLGFFGNSQKVLGVRPPERLRYDAALLQSFASIFVDGLEHHKAWLAPCFFLPQ